MPHQCLNCGKVFEEGSSQLLKGCPDCGGNRFFFTKKPLNEKQRNTKKEEVGKDVNTAIQELMKEQNKEVMDKSGNWVKIKPKEVRKMMKKQLSNEEKKHVETKEDIENLSDEYRNSMINKIKNQPEKIAKNPETINIEKAGKYNIDLKGLLEEEPIIIQKDGSYTIHLPSAFKLADKNRK